MRAVYMQGQNCMGGPLSWVVIGIQGSWVQQV